MTYLKLVSELTDGTTVSINATGTTITFIPGTISGGEFDFDCRPQIFETSRSILYFIEGIL